MTRNDAYQILTKYLKNKNLLKHSLATEAAMRGIYNYLIPADKQNPEDKEKWGITGLLHDVDYELTINDGDLNKHGLLIFEKEASIPDNIAHAIKSHNPLTQIEPQSNLDWAIRTSDQLTGLIVAAALVLPDKKITNLTPDSILKRFKEKSFAKGVDREQIILCEEKLSIPLPEFVEIVLEEMQKIGGELGL